MLVGPPGAGKSSVGRALARRRGVTFRDTDDDIAATAGKDIPAIFYDDGEEHFRALEAAAVVRALAEHTGVLALGGGAVLSPATRDALRGHLVVFLDVGAAAAARRVGLGRGRPVLTLNPRAALNTLLAQRRPLYQEVATHTVPTDDRTPVQVADAVLAALG